MKKKTKRKQPKKYSDWYEIKCKKWEQEMLDELANLKRQTKAERRRLTETKIRMRMMRLGNQ